MYLIDIKKKWKLKSWTNGEHIKYENGSWVTNEGNAIYSMAFNSDQWEEYTEPEKIKVWYRPDTGSFYFSMEKTFLHDVEATPEQLKQIREALGIKENL